MMRHGLRAVAFVVLVAVAEATRAGTTPDAGARARRLESLHKELGRLQREMESLVSRERGLLGDVARLDAAIALDSARLEEASLRLRDTEESLSASQREMATVEAAQARRAPYLASRVRELYKQGSAGMLARLLAPAAAADGRDGIRYAGYVVRRDATQLAEWRDASRRLDQERTILAAARDRLAVQKAEASRSKSALEQGRAERAKLLARIRGDREQHAKAIEEIEAAAKDLGRLLDSLDDSGATVALDVRKFRGLLDWPADGPVTAGFGKVIHPRFKTEIPHPGVDIDAMEGAPFRAVFDGRVAYAAALHGYGLTVVLDHGNGVVSIYAHAGVLVVEAGQDVARGQDLGRVGDSGSLRGPYLYFEVRVAGKPDDPVGWLRPR
jgi:septal ring factor EnvC (AmiA/AmiB activator)